jgi:hypothetical protein
MLQVQMIFLALVAVFVYVVATGPAGIEWRAKRRLRLDAPMAKVYYLPSACCQVGEPEPVEQTVEAELRRQRLERAMQAQENVQKHIQHQLAGCTTFGRCEICDSWLDV